MGNATWSIHNRKSVKSVPARSKTKVSVGILYLYRLRQRVEPFCLVLLRGTLIPYALLPAFAAGVLQCVGGRQDKRVAEVSEQS